MISPCFELSGGESQSPRRKDRRLEGQSVQSPVPGSIEGNYRW